MKSPFFAGVVALALASTACSTATTGRMNLLDARAAAPGTPTYLGMPLRTGQLVLTEAPGAYSFAFELIPETFYPFTHVAIVAIENGEPVVYDVTGEYKTTGLHNKLLTNVHGGMRRTPFYEYVAPNLYAEIYDPPAGVDGERMAAFARKKFAEHVEFDAFFQYADHKKLFCTELVNLAILDAGGKPKALVPTRDNPSLKMAMKWLDVPLESALPAGLYKDNARYVGALGQFTSRTAAYSYFEAKREISRRFTKDQRLGFLFEMHSTGDISTRPEIDGFMDRATHLFDEWKELPPPGDPRIGDAVRNLADAMLGPTKQPAAQPQAALKPAVRQIR
ncbi:MAG: hypothetical protein ABI461_00315 [Polyangiaceae bacterium]